MILTEKESFADAVYDIVRRIPPGRATSYGAIAKAIGYPNFSRMVGAVLGKDVSSLGIPAHRVVNSQGVLSGRLAFVTPTKMQELLEEEGVIVVDNKIRHWKKVFWNPIEEILLD